MIEIRKGDGTNELGYYLCVKCDVSTPVKSREDLDLNDPPRCIDCNIPTAWVLNKDLGRKHDVKSLI